MNNKAHVNIIISVLTIVVVLVLLYLYKNAIETAYFSFDFQRLALFELLYFTLMGVAFGAPQLRQRWLQGGTWRVNVGVAVIAVVLFLLGNMMLLKVPLEIASKFAFLRQNTVHFDPFMKLLFGYVLTLIPQRV